MRSSPTSIRPPKRLPLVLALALAAACGSDPVDPGPPIGQNDLELRPVDAAAPGADFGAVEVLAQLTDLTEERFGATWEVSGGRSRFIDRQGQGALALERDADTRVRIPVALDAVRTDRVRLELVNRSAIGASIEAVLLRDGRRLAGASASLAWQKDPQEVELLFKGLRAKPGPADALELLLPRSNDSLGLLSVTIEDLPPADYLPAATHGAVDLVSIVGDSRRSTCLTSGAALAVDVPAERTASTLRFSYGMPLAVLPAGAPARLELTLDFGQPEPETRSLAFPEPIPGTSGWRTHEVDLAPFAGRAGAVSFRLTSDDGADLVCALGQPVLIDRVETPPTVLFITSDTHRDDHLGFLEHGVEVRTPTIDALAASGVVFTNAYSNANSTAPSHSALLTGLPPRDTGIIANGKRLAPEARTLTEVFREAGYATLASVSALPVTHTVSGFGQGFDRFGVPAGTTVHGSPVTLDRLLEWLPEYEHLPLFVWVHIYDAHTPYEFHPETDGRPKPEDLTAIQENLLAYRSEITFLDRELARLLELPRMREATVAFTSDHGEVLDKGSDELFNHIGLSRSTLAVPLILRSPGLTGGREIHEPVETLHLGRTLLQLSGHDLARFPGDDLLTMALDAELPRFAIESHGDNVSAQRGRWFFTMRLRGKPSLGELAPADLHAVRLFDLEADPECERNVWEEHLEVTAELRQLAIDWLLAAEPMDWSGAGDLSQADLAKDLAALGYLMADDEGGGTGSAWFEPACACPWCARLR